MGAIDLKVPRAREGGSAGGAVFERYKRRSAEVDDTMVAAYVHGASTRDIGQITEALMGEHVSRSTVSRVAKTLGTKVEDLRKAPIEGPIPYLFLDATFLDARWAREVENVSALVAYGVGLDGHRRSWRSPSGRRNRRPPGATCSPSSTSAASRGCSRSSQMPNAGLAKAVRHHLPEAPLQRCVVHLQRNIVGKAPQKLRARLAKAVWQAFLAPRKADARRRMAELASDLGRQLPESMACLADGFEQRQRPLTWPELRRAR